MKVLRSSALFALLAGLGLALPAFAQAPNAPLGVVVSPVSAHIGNSAASDGATVYSGDFLSTDDGGSLLVRIGAISVELQSSSSAHLYRAPYGAVLELNSGSVVYSTPGNAAQNVVIVASDVRVTPVLDKQDLGRVSVDDPCNVTVQAERGQADVRVGSESRLVEEGKAYRVRAENSISYRKYLSPEDPDYHKYHEHKPCAAAYQTAKGRPPISGGHSPFLYVVIGTGIAVTAIPVAEAFESPNRP